MLSTPVMTVDEVLAAIAREVKPLPTVRLPLAQAAGLTLAAPVCTDIDSPPFNKALMDGYAMRAGDCSSPGARLNLIGGVAAGQMPARALACGEAMQISTGAPLPPGADAVVMVEETELSADGRSVLIRQAAEPDQHLLRQGSESRAGDTVLSAGTLLDPAQVAAAAAAGAGDVEVHRRPRVGVLVTGDELAPFGRRPEGGQIRDANAPCLLALAHCRACETADLGIATDTREALTARLRPALGLGGRADAPKPDVICISGGVSMGPYDHVPEVLAELGVRLVVRKVAIRPGKPMVFGVAPDGQLLFGLPGNPVSTFVTFVLFVRAAIDGLQGRPITLPPTVVVTLTGAVPATGWRTEFIPASLEFAADGTWRATATRWQGSSDVFALARSNGLLIRQPNALALPAGSTLPAIPLSFAV